MKKVKKKKLYNKTNRNKIDNILNFLYKLNIVQL